MTARDAALELARRLIAAGHEALFAGGCVRDRLLGRTPKDFDIATSARPEQVMKLFPGSNEVGAHFGVVIAKHGGFHVEIATFRTDGSYRDYLEDRRPNSQGDPYQIASRILKTISLVPLPELPA